MTEDEAIEVATKPVPDIRYSHGDLTITLLGDAEDIVPWLEAGPDNKAHPPSSKNFDEFLAVITSTEDSQLILEAINAGQFKAKARYDAAQRAWRNSMRLPELEELTDKVQRLKGTLDDALSTIRSAKKAAADEVDPGIPFGDSSDSTEVTESDGGTRSEPPTDTTRDELESPTL